MKPKPSSRRKRSSAKSVLRLPDLEHAKAAVLNSLNSMDAKRGYRHAIDEAQLWKGCRQTDQNRRGALRTPGVPETRSCVDCYPHPSRRPVGPSAVTLCM